MDIQDFFKRFNLKPEEFDRLFKISGSGSIREIILKSELKDFEYLSETVEEINEIQEKLLDRFKIEARNSFSVEIRDTYVELIIKTEDLIVLLQEKQLPFYKTRINEIKDELENMN